MKRTIVLLIASLTVSGALYALHASSVSGMSHAYFVSAPIAWSETTHDFGKIKAGTPVSHEFSFTNNGEEALVITSVKASCGCTVTSYTKEPVPPGEKGYVKATFDASKKGIFTKSVTVNANVDSPVQLFIKGEVID